MIQKRTPTKAVSIAVVTAMVLFGTRAAEAAIVNLPVSDPSFEQTPVYNHDYIFVITSEWKAHSQGNYIYNTDYGADTTDPTHLYQATHGYGTGYQWQATTSIFGSDGFDSVFTFSALISHDDPGKFGDAILYFYDAGIDGTLAFDPFSTTNNILSSASFTPINNSWVRQQVTFDASTPAGLAVEGNRVGIAMYLDTPYRNGAAADDVILTGPIVTPPPPQSALEIRVDRATGLITMDNIDVDAGEHEISYYEIGSTMGALDPTEGTGWNSLSDQNIDPIGIGVGQTWDEAGASDANILSEAFLFGSSVFSDGETQGLGNAFAGTELADEDLIFQYAFDGPLETGVVTYFGVYGPVFDPGDFDGNGTVNGDDYLLWQLDPSVGSLAEWEDNYGTVYSLSAISASVPEPTTLALALAALCWVVGRRR